MTVNGSAADYRRGEYFQERVSVNNASAPVRQSVSVSTSGGGSTSGNVHVPGTSEVYQYDLDGNLAELWTDDGVVKKFLSRAYLKRVSGIPAMFGDFTQTVNQKF